MTTVLHGLGDFMVYAIAAIFAQNAVFSRALGVSRLVRLIDDTAVNKRSFGVLLCSIQLISAPLAWLCSQALAGWGYRRAVRPLAFVLCATVAYLLVMCLIQVVFKLPGAKELVAVLPLAAFNTAVLGPLLIADTQSYTLPQTLAFALGSGVGYMLAVAIVAEGQRKLQNRAVPGPFRGLPITLLYIGILALAIYGFTGHTPAI